MKYIRMFMFILAILGTWGAALAEEGKVSGDVTLTGVLRDGRDTNAKFNEYRDIRDGLQTDIQLKYDSAKSHASFEAQNILYRDQKYTLEGGLWDVFSAKVFYEEIPHQYTYDARTFYSGVGGNNLTYTGTPSSSPNAWNPFDYTVKRRNIGGSIKFDYLNPFFAELSIEQQKKTGVYPMAAAGTTPGGMGIELPVSLDYIADNVKAEAGYSGKLFYISTGVFYSRFTSGDNHQYFRNPATANTAAATDTLYLPPENDYVKIDLKGSVALPFKSKINAEVATARARSNSLLANRYVSNVTAGASNIGIQGLTGISLSSPFFNGNVSTDQVNLALTTNPKPFVNGKIFYKYYNKDNKSDVVTTTDSTQATPVFSNPLFDYRKNTYGIEGSFKLPADLRLNAGYSFVKTERARHDIPKNRDNLFDIGLKWSGLKFMNMKVGYEHLERAAEFNVESTVPPQSYEYWLRRFDAGAQIRNTYKAALELYPLDALSINMGYKFKMTNYSDTLLGMTEAKGHEVNADIEWQVHERVRLTGHFDFEQRIQSQFIRYRNSGTFDSPYDNPTSISYNWTSTATENTYGYGVGADITVITDKLKLNLAHNFVKSDGVVDYTYLLGAVALPVGYNQDNIDLNAWDNYRLSNFLVRATYQATKMISVTAAYVYEAYSYDDCQYRNYNYIPGTTGYMTGAYSNDSYKNHVIFAGVNIKF